MDNFKDIWKQRKFIFYLAKNDFKTKYAGSFLGIIWAFIQPLVTILVYTIVFQFALKSGPIDGTPFVLWLMAGLIPWFFFQESLVNTTNSLVEYSYLVKKIKFDIKILPIVKLESSIFVHVFFMLVLVVMAALCGYYPGIILVQLLYYSLALAAFVFAIAYFMAAVNIFVKDLNQIISVILSIGVWACPIMWNVNSVSPIVEKICRFNPVYYIVAGYRDTIINNIWFWEKPLWSFGYWCALIVLFVISKKVYLRLKPHFSDLL